MTLASTAPQSPALLLPGADFGCIKAAAKQTPWVLASPGGFSANPEAALPDPLGSLRTQQVILPTNNLPKTRLWSIVQFWLGSMPPPPVPTQGSEQALPQQQQATESRRGANLPLSLQEISQTSWTQILPPFLRIKS